MTKIIIDIEYIKNSLENIGYEINDCIERNNQGKNWQIKFNNSGAVVTIYDSNNMRNTVVNGKADEDEKAELKKIIDEVKCKELKIHPLNKRIVDLINSKKEDYFYDFKEQESKDKESLLHDILCLSNNTENKEAYLIYGVSDKHEVVGMSDEIKSNDILDFIKSLHFAGEHMPDIEIVHLLYKYKRIAVIICKSSKNVPFYLEERYRGINDHQIYTRIGDTNTPKTRNATYIDTEKLWKIHFDCDKK